MMEDADHRFVGHLEWLREKGDRAKLAALRRALGKEPLTAAQAWPIVMPYVPEHASEPVERIYFLVGALFALHQQSWPRAEGDRAPHDFGASMRLLAERRPGRGVERRFAALLASDEDTVAEHLRHSVALLKSDGVPIDWRRLISDLRCWSEPLQRSKRQWARSFWGGTSEDQEQAESTVGSN
jgi:CRISPR system Cascade subunit CasB